MPCPLLEMIAIFLYFDPYLPNLSFRTLAVKYYIKWDKLKGSDTHTKRELVLELQKENTFQTPKDLCEMKYGTVSFFHLQLSIYKLLRRCCGI